MIIHFSIFHKGGHVLWSKSNVSAVKGAPIDDLVRTVLLEGRSDSSMTHDTYTVKWTFANEYDLVFTAVYLTVARLSYVDDMLKKVKSSFLKAHGDTIKSILAKNSRASIYNEDGFPFDKQWNTILSSFEDNETQIQTKGRQIRNYGEKKSKTASKSSTKGETASSKTTAAAAKSDVSDESDDDDDDEDESDSGDETPASPSGGGLDEATRQANLAKLRARGKGKGKGRRGGGSSGAVKPATPKSPTTPSKKPVKKMAKWSDSVSKAERAALDQSEAVTDEQQTAADLAFRQKFLPDASKKTDLDAYDESESEAEDESDDEGAEHDNNKKKSSGLFRFFKKLTGTQEMERQDLEPVIKQLSEVLMAKNVGAEIAEQFCESVCQNLLGKKLGTMQTVKSLVHEAMEKSLTNILTPKRSIDILRDIAAAKKARRVYSIVFVGVNGVGKSTSLSKVCFWLQQNGVKVQIVACDTFRSGAVEQLRTHARCLNVDLYEKGYGKDASSIAMDGIKDAQARGIECVLIDTAGRMQDNKNLMISLAKLVSINSPDLILFVGEALVGNDAVDQVTKFNESLADNSTAEDPRLIDGIILTKFDTIDDKVGAALSMVYTTGQPIVFVGVGQTYTDLKKLNVKQVTKALLK